MKTYIGILKVIDRRTGEIGLENAGRWIDKAACKKALNNKKENPRYKYALGIINEYILTEKEWEKMKENFYFEQYMIKRG